MNKNLLGKLNSNAEDLESIIKMANTLNPVKPLGERCGKVIGQGIDKLADYIFGREVV
ncbi:MAG: hypothetical protein ACOCV1_07480 [Bacillota bacterium]